MGLILVTGASTGLGLAATRALMEEGHDVVLHARRAERVEDRDVLGRVHAVVTGDLADLNATVALAEDVNALGRLDAVIHNAAVMGGEDVMTTNVVAPFVLTAVLESPRRSLFISSSMHWSGSPDLEVIDGRKVRRQPYEDSKLLVTTLAMACARIFPDAMAHAVDPGWVPTRMGGPGAPDDLAQGHQTQQWLATAPEGEIRPRSGGYWYHRSTRQPHPITEDRVFQDDLVDRLSAATGLDLV